MKITLFILLFPLFLSAQMTVTVEKESDVKKITSETLYAYTETDIEDPVEAADYLFRLDEMVLQRFAEIKQEEEKSNNKKD